MELCCNNLSSHDSIFFQEMGVPFFVQKLGPPFFKEIDVRVLAALFSLLSQLNSARKASVMTRHAFTIVWRIVHSILLLYYSVNKYGQSDISAEKCT